MSARGSSGRRIHRCRVAPPSAPVSTVPRPNGQSASSSADPGRPRRPPAPAAGAAERTRARPASSSSASSRPGGRARRRAHGRSTSASTRSRPSRPTRWIKTARGCSSSPSHASPARAPAQGLAREDGSAAPGHRARAPGGVRRAHRGRPPAARRPGAAPHETGNLAAARRIRGRWGEIQLRRVRAARGWWSTATSRSSNARPRRRTGRPAAGRHREAPGREAGRDRL